MAPGSDSLQRWLEAARTRRLAKSLQRKPVPATRHDGAEVTIGGRRLVNFSSNDYLGLANDARLSEAMAAAARQYGAGSGASALISGYGPLHQELEAGLARFLGREAALLFPSGYHANLAVLTALAGRGDRIVQDRLCHASLIDGARLSGARLLRYQHADIESLERQLAQGGEGHTLIVTDGVFSMDGDIAPLAEIASCCARHDAWLVVDDAHGLGVLGRSGRGSAEHLDVPDSGIPVLIGTLGKSFGISGAFVAGDEALIDHVANRGRSYMYTTSMPPSLAAAGLAALEAISGDPALRRRLHARISQFREGAARLDLDLMPSETAIQPLLAGEAAAALEMSQRLADRGYLVVAIRPPTVPAGSSRLRITLSAAHSEEQVEGLLTVLRQCQASC